MKEPLTFSYEPKNDRLIIEGIKYSGSFFRALSENGLMIGVPFQIVSREDGRVVIKTLLNDD